MRKDNAAVKNMNLNEAQIPCEKRIDINPPPKKVEQTGSLPGFQESMY